jgi:hypothetical protein
MDDWGVGKRLPEGVKYAEAAATLERWRDDPI